MQSKIKDFNLSGLNYQDGGGGVQMVCYQSVPYDPSVWPRAIQEAVKEIEGHRGMKAMFVMVNKLDPGVVIEKHTDTLKCVYRLERWHLPLVTNPKAWHFQGKQLHLPQGVWFGPVPYWEEHYGGNEGTTARIHLIVDLDPMSKAKVIELSAESKLQLTSGM